jgi:hypothetical protein
MLIGDIKDAVDQFLQDNKQKLINRQNAYHAKHGCYWQGVQTPATPPDDGALVAPDLTTKAGGFRSTWGHVLKGDNAWPATWPCAARVDTFRSKSGDGWTITVFVTKNGKTHFRTKDYFGQGDTQWAQVPDPIVPPPVDENEDLP